MVFYECVMTTKNTTPFYTLTALVKDVSHKVVANGGIVRSIQNHGIRDLPHRFRSKYPDREGNRYFTKGRFISIYYDSSPTTMREVELILRRKNDVVLRTTHLKARNPLWEVNNPREDKNPYIQRVLELETMAASEQGKSFEEELEAETSKQDL